MAIEILHETDALAGGGTVLENMVLDFAKKKHGFVSKSGADYYSDELVRDTFDRYVLEQHGIYYSKPYRVPPEESEEIYPEFARIYSLYPEKTMPDNEYFLEFDGARPDYKVYVHRTEWDCGETYFIVR